MTEEQTSLFPDLQPSTAATASPGLSRQSKKEVSLFLPGVKNEQSFPEFTRLDELASQAKQCENCGLRATCQQVVFAEGLPQARLMFIGEGPGADEDAAGLPFVGRAGQLLNRILAACAIERNEVYITNVVKCRPPGNRLPHPDEVKACIGYLEAQIRIIKPAIIVCLGALATQTVIDARAKITSARGVWYSRGDIKLMPTFHPAALLRREEWKKPAWEDFKKIRDAYRGLYKEEDR
ncbi:MAG: uracil-DNA glycosylase [Methylocystaceae bacterium]